LNDRSKLINVVTIAYLDGEFRPLEDVRISPLDRGFLFGDGVYEVIPVYAGRLFRADAHLQRLERSLAGIRLEDPLGRAGWHGLLDDIVQRNGGGNQAVYLQVTRGAAPRDHAFPDGISATVFAMTRMVDGQGQTPALHAVTREDIRWTRCDIKSVALLPNVLMRQEARESSASEAILIRDGMLTEGTASNVFVAEGNVVRTPPRSQHILGGITRDLLIELAHDADMDCREEPVTEAELRAAGEIWVSSSTKEVAPVVRLDGRPVGEGVAGPLWERMHGLFQDFKQRLIRGDVD
jgi:D-alanine transaminase